MKEEIEYKSKTKKKKEADALQKLGLELAGLSVAQLKRIDIPKELRDALIAGKSITAKVAARRHRQFIGVLMRDVDPESIQDALDGVDDDIQQGSSAVPDPIQEWIDKLLSESPEETEETLQAHPALDRQRLRQLVRNIKKEKPGAKPSKSRRTLEQLLGDVLSDP